ncbi:unnamed protein product [Echinostoma caproni]|uniref:ANK_REP_REGION domain-containing protein n=1 Tax=Echinostoma caproni TaxID=27848 RepID=A0A183AK00_9TREM|nr:unnamed protein product [Echinostoma caproni]
MCELLMRYGADVNGRDADQWTPLHTAAACRHVDICDCLLNHNADILATNVDGSIPYDIADDDDTSKFLLDEMKLRDEDTVGSESGAGISVNLMNHE